MSTEGGNKAVIAALLANTGIAVTKFIAFAITGATSMLAEAIHSVADSGNQALLLVGGSRSKREATTEHPFGFGRERYIYAFLVSIVLFTLGGLFALYEAYHKFHEVREGHEDKLLTSSLWWVALVVLGLAIVMEGFSFRTAIGESNKVRGHRSWWSFIRTAKAPELPVVLLEDFAALLGLVFAFAGVSLTKLTANGYFDVIGAASIGTLLVIVAIVLGIEVKSLLVGESATQGSIDAIRGAIEVTPGVTRIIHMKTLHMSPESLLVAVKFGVDGDTTGSSVAATINAAEANIRRAEPMAESIYLEPDLYRSDYVRDERPEAPSAPAH